jgi:hypothetical protein
VVEKIAYSQDFYSWSLQQAQLLRTRQFDQVDWAHVIEELEDLGRSEYRALVSAIEQLTLHLLKWQYQPHRRSLSWRHSINKQRRQIDRLLEDNPGMKPKLGEAMAQGYKYGRKGASQETGLPLESLPDICPYAWAELQNEDYWPD